MTSNKVPLEARNARAEEWPSEADERARLSSESMGRRLVQDEGRRGQPGAVFYRVVSEQPAIVEATVVDRSGRTWTGTGPRCRAAYHAIIEQLEAVAQKDPAANALFGVIDDLPPDDLPGPRQGNLFPKG
jgi:hypothetical protein